MTFPKTILSDVAWSFRQPAYKDDSWLVKAVDRFHTAAHGVPPPWQPEAIVLAARHVRIRVGSREITLRPRMPAGFTSAELLFAVHKLAREALDGRDDHFSCGLQLIEEQSVAPALYEVETAYWLATAAEQPRESLPAKVMWKVHWSFMQPRVQDRARFREAAADYDRIGREDGAPGAWNADELVVPAPVIGVAYDFPGYGDTKLLVLRSDDSTGFTMVELLHKIHLGVAPGVGRADHHFFEGLTLVRPPSRKTPPAYSMFLGS